MPSGCRRCWKSQGGPRTRGVSSVACVQRRGEHRAQESWTSRLVPPGLAPKASTLLCSPGLRPPSSASASRSLPSGRALSRDGPPSAPPRAPPRPPHRAGAPHPPVSAARPPSGHCRIERAAQLHLVRPAPAAGVPVSQIALGEQVPAGGLDVESTGRPRRQSRRSTSATSVPASNSPVRPSAEPAGGSTRCATPHRYLHPTRAVPWHCDAGRRGGRCHGGVVSAATAPRMPSSVAAAAARASGAAPKGRPPRAPTRQRSHGPPGDGGSATRGPPALRGASPRAGAKV